MVQGREEILGRISEFCQNSLMLISDMFSALFLAIGGSGMWT